MPLFKKKSSKLTTEDFDASSTSSSSSSSKSSRLLPIKAAAKRVKRHFRRLDETLHHVMRLPKHRVVGEQRPLAITFAAPHSPVFPTVAVLCSYPSPPSSPRSNRSRDSWTHQDDKYYDSLHKEVEERSRRTSLSRQSFVPENDVFSSIDMASHHQEESALPSLLSHLSVVEEEGKREDHGSLIHEPMFSSPPTVYVEPEVPDPFLIDDEGDALSDNETEEGSSAAVSESRQTASPADDVPLSIPASPSLQFSPRPSALLSPNVNKDVPPPPPIESGEDEDEVPELYLPGLIIPTMFLPIPNTDPLTTLLTKYIYPPERRPTRDVTGEWQHSDFHTLVMTNSWRALARMARDRITSSDPSDLNLILGLWHLRLSCLARLRLFNQTAAECTNLFAVLNAVEPVEARVYLFDRVLPFELEVMQTRLKYWSGDYMGYLDALTALLKKCQTKARQGKSDPTNLSMWKERGARVALIMASQLVEMKEFTAAARLLEPLCTQKEGGVNPALRSSVARIYLQGGNLQAAAKHMAVVASDPTVEEKQIQLNAALLASAQGDWEKASETLRRMIEQDADNFVAVNDLSVALLSQGKLKEGIDVLETALKASPSSVVVAEPFLFNLSTLYELRSAFGLEKKRELLIEVAKWSGDGLKAACLKLPAN